MIAMYEKKLLFKQDTYFNQCHAPYITEMPNHKLFVSFFGGTREKAKDVGSWLVTKPIESACWSEPRLFLKAKKKSMGGGHFFVSPDKHEIWLFYNLMHGPGWSTCNTARHIYTKDGWQPRDYIRKMIGWNTRGKVLVLDNGNYLMPMHDELLGYKAYFLLSKDFGRTWKSYGPVRTEEGCLEPTVVQLRNGILLCFLRTKEREVYQSWSLDRGKTWTKATSTGIPNPDSMVELLVLPDGTLVHVYNHSKITRSPLNVSYSTDNGKTWSHQKTLEDGGAEFSYPCMIYGSDGLIHLVYTYKRKTIAYAKFSQEWLME